MRRFGVDVISCVLDVFGFGWHVNHRAVDVLSAFEQKPCIFLSIYAHFYDT